MGSEARKEVSIAAGISSSPERPYVKGGNGGNERAFVVASPGEEGERVAARSRFEEDESRWLRIGEWAFRPREWLEWEGEVDGWMEGVSE